MNWKTKLEKIEKQIASHISIITKVSKEKPKLDNITEGTLLVWVRIT